jgi:hypothetical protein
MNRLSRQARWSLVLLACALMEAGPARATAFPTPFEPWQNMGGGVGGTAGRPWLEGTGSLVGGESFVLEMSVALPGAPAWFVLGQQKNETPFKGASLSPDPDLVIGPLLVQPAGTLALHSTWPAGLPSGFQLWAQCWILDPGAVEGWAASNTLLGLSP